MIRITDNHSDIHSTHQYSDTQTTMDVILEQARKLWEGQIVTFPPSTKDLHNDPSLTQLQTGLRRPAFRRAPINNPPRSRRRASTLSSVPSLSPERDPILTVITCTESRLHRRHPHTKHSQHALDLAGRHGIDVRNLCTALAVLQPTSCTMASGEESKGVIGGIYGGCGTRGD